MMRLLFLAVDVLLFLLSPSLVHVSAKEDRVPTCKDINEDYYDYDHTVVCNDEDATGDDISYDFSYFDPKKAPWRCRHHEWDPTTQSNLPVTDPFYVCILWHELYGVLRPATGAPTTIPVITSAPTMMTTTAMPTAQPTQSPTTGIATATTTASPPTVTSTTITATPVDDDENIGGTTTTHSIPLEPFTLRIVVPAQVSRRLQEQNTIPYNQEELIQITKQHMAAYLANELNRKDNVLQVALHIVQSQVVENNGGRSDGRSSSTILAVDETMTGMVYFDTTSYDQNDSSSSATVTPSSRTVQALAIQSLEGQAMWEFFFRLRGANDTFLQKTREVTLVRGGTEDDAASTSSSSSSTFSPGVVATLVVIGTVTAAIVAYFVYWLRKQNELDRQHRDVDDTHGKKQKAADTPDTQTSDPFFPQDYDDNHNNNADRRVKTKPRRSRHRSTRKKSSTSTSSQGGSAAGAASTASSMRLNDDVISTGSLSFVSSALHSIREHSLEDEEEEPDDDELVEPEPPSRDRLWGDDSEASEIEIQTELLENTPPLNYKPADATPAEDYDGKIHRIMSLETNYSTIHGTEVTRRDVEVAPGTTGSTNKRPTEKPANRWLLWKTSTRRAQKKRAEDAKQRAIAQQQRPVRPQQPSEFETALDPPSMVDVSFDPPPDPPSQVDIEAGDMSLEGESINVSEF